MTDYVPAPSDIQGFGQNSKINRFIGVQISWSSAQLADTMNDARANPYIEKVIDIHIAIDGDMFDFTQAEFVALMKFGRAYFRDRTPLVSAGEGGAS